MLINIKRIVTNTYNDCRRKNKTQTCKLVVALTLTTTKIQKKKKGIPNCTYSQSIMKTKQFKKETYIFIIF